MSATAKAVEIGRRLIAREAIDEFIAVPFAERSDMSARTPKFFTTDQIAECLDVSPRTVRRWIKSGDLPVHRFGAAARISEVDLRAFLAIHREG